MSDDLPPSMFDGDDNLDNIWQEHADDWDAFAEYLDYGEEGGHELFEDVAEALSERGYGQGDGFSIAEWMNGITDITDFYQDEQGKWHIQFEFDLERDEGRYTGVRGW